MRKKTIKYTDEPIGEVRVMKDFLPKPQDLDLKVKLINESELSIDFLKKEES